MMSTQHENGKSEVRTVMAGLSGGKKCCCGSEDPARFMPVYPGETVIAAVLAILCTVLMAFPDIVAADSAGPRYPSNGSNNSSIGNTSWSYTGNVGSSDNSDARSSLSGGRISNYLVATDFGFSVPANATITGIQVDIERADGNRSSSAYLRDNSVKIVKRGSITGSDHANTSQDWPTSDQVASYGSDSDLWGTAWTPADINSSNFGAALSVRNTSSSRSEDAYVDAMRVTVFYSVAPACTAAAPTVTIIPATQTITTNGGSAVYSVTVRNNDTGAGCTSVTYALTLSNSNTAAFNASTLSSTSVSLAAGGTSSPITLTVNGKSGQTTGTNTTTVTAAASGHANGSSSVNTTLNVAATCLANTPTLQISPVSGSVAVGETATYAVTVLNNDTAACSPATFTLSVVSDSNSANFNTPSALDPINLLLGPGQSGTSALAVSARNTAVVNAENTTIVRVTAAGHASPANVTVLTAVAVPGASLLHNSITTNSSRWASEGGWGVAGGKYGEFVCETCHTADTSNIKRVKQQITVPDTSKGNIPGSAVVFQRTSGMNSFGDDTGGHATSSKICEVCHSQTSIHKYNQQTYVGHESPAASDCTYCHKHNKGFKPAGGCTICHAMPQGNRIAVVGQFSGSSHHVQGVALTDQHCYQCHWEANSDGSINTTYHGGAAAPGAAVNLVIYGAGSRPAMYTLNTTAVEYTGNGQRTELQKINSHCLGCHSAQNNMIQPFGDGKTPKQYAWDNTSVAERYSQTGTTTWGKYTTTANAAQKNIIKAFSAHGNAGANARGWNTTSGVDGVITNTSGTVSVTCFDCHNSHGSNVGGTTTSYTSATQNGGILKDTAAGKGGYTVTYKPASGGSATNKNAYNAGAGLCFDCHLTANGGTTKPWGYQGTFGATQAIMGYMDTPYFGPGTFGRQLRYAYKSTPNMGGHFGASSAMSASASQAIGGLCTPCHDPHGVSTVLGANQKYGVPLLKGTWLTSPYKEDATTADNQNYIATAAFYYNGEYEGPTLSQAKRDAQAAAMRSYRIDQNTFGSGDNTVMNSTLYSISETDAQFAGLCLNCHQKQKLTNGTTHTWKSKDRIHESVKGWKTANATKQHFYTCSKCHAPHNASLPRLMVSNCLDSKHRGRVTNNTNPTISGSYRKDKSSGSGKQPGSYSAIVGEDGRTTINRAFTCHENNDTTQKWNVKTPWVK